MGEVAPTRQNSYALLATRLSAVVFAGLAIAPTYNAAVHQVHVTTARTVGYAADITPDQMATLEDWVETERQNRNDESRTALLFWAASGLCAGASILDARKGKNKQGKSTQTEKMRDLAS